MTLESARALVASRMTMGVVTPGNFKNGLTIEFQDSVWKVLSFQQTKTARQAAMVRTKLKNLISGTTVDTTFRISETVNTANVEKAEAIYSYSDGDNFVFMDGESFDEVIIDADKLGGNTQFLKEGMKVEIVNWGDTIVDVNLPVSEDYEVTYTEPGLKKAANTGQSKSATLDTGAEITVPLFVEIGDNVKVNLDDKSYVERVKNK